MSKTNTKQSQDKYPNGRPLVTNRNLVNLGTIWCLLNSSYVEHGAMAHKVSSQVETDHQVETRVQFGDNGLDFLSDTGFLMNLEGEEGQDVTMLPITSQTIDERVTTDAPQSLTQSTSDSQIQIGGNADHRNKLKMMEGIENPIDRTESNIRATMKNIDSHLDLGSDMGIDINASPHNNFENIFQTMQHSAGHISDSNLQEEKNHYGENNKQMGQMVHRDSNEPVRKVGTTMGNLENIQLDSQNKKDQLREENKKLIKKVNIGQMFQKFEVNQENVKKLAQGIKKDEQDEKDTPQLPPKVFIKTSVKSNDKEKKQKAIALLAQAVKKHSHSHHSSQKQKNLEKKLSLETQQLLVQANHALETSQNVQIESKHDSVKNTKKQAKCPVCPQQSHTNQWDELNKKSNQFKVQLSDDSGTNLGQKQTPTDMQFMVVPKDAKNGIPKDIQVLSSERIGFNPYTNTVDPNGLYDREKLLMVSSDDADYYNVTVSMIVKKETIPLDLGSSDQPSIKLLKSKPQKQSSQNKDFQLVFENTNNNKDDSAPNKNDLVSVTTTSDTKSSFEAAASLGDQDQVKEIADSSNYMSSIALQQASTMITEEPLVSSHDDSSPSQLSLFDVLPPADINVQIKSHLSPPSEHTLLQLNSDIKLPIQNLVDNTQLIQLTNRIRERIRQKKQQQKRASADSFDQGDGSTHKDDDIDYDMIQAVAMKKQQNEQQIAQQKVEAISQKETQQEQAQAIEQEQEQVVEQNSDSIRYKELRRETLEKDQHKAWMQKLLKQGMAVAGNEESINKKQEESIAQQDEAQIKVSHKHHVRKPLPQKVIQSVAQNTEEAQQEDQEGQYSEEEIREGDQQSQEEQRQMNGLAQQEGEQNEQDENGQQYTERQDYDEQIAEKVKEEERNINHRQIQKASLKVAEDEVVVDEVAEKQFEIGDMEKEEQMRQDQMEKDDQQTQAQIERVEKLKFAEMELEEQARKKMEKKLKARKAQLEKEEKLKKAEMYKIQMERQIKVKQAQIEKEEAQKAELEREEQIIKQADLQKEKEIEKHRKAQIEKQQKEKAKHALIQEKIARLEMVEKIKDDQRKKEEKLLLKKKMLEETIRKKEIEETKKKQDAKLKREAELKQEAKLNREVALLEAQKKREKEAKTKKEVEIKRKAEFLEAKKQKEAQLKKDTEIKAKKLREFKLAEAKKQRESKLNEEREFKLKEAKSHMQKVQKKITFPKLSNQEDEDKKLFRQQMMIENNIEREISQLQKIMDIRKKDGGKNLYKFKLIREQMAASSVESVQKPQAKSPIIVPKPMSPHVVKQKVIKTKKHPKVVKEVKDDGLDDPDAEVQKLKDLIKEQVKQTKKYDSLEDVDEDQKLKQITKNQEKLNKSQKQPMVVKDESSDDSEGDNLKSKEIVKEKEQTPPPKKTIKKQKNKKILNEKTKDVSDKSLQKSVQLLKKKTAQLSDDFDKPETKKESHTESQIKLLEDTKEKLLEDHHHKNKKTIKKVISPDLWQNDPLNKKLHKIGQKVVVIQKKKSALKKVQTKKQKQKTKLLSKSKIQPTPQIISDDKKQSDTLISNYLKDKVEDELTKVPVKETKHKFPIQQVAQTSVTTQIQEEDQSMIKTQNELKQISKELEDAQKQADEYQKERQFEELQVSSKIVNSMNFSSPTNDSSLSMTNESMSLTNQPADVAEISDQQNMAIIKDEKEAMAQVNKAKVEGEKIGAEAAAKMIATAQNQSESENELQFQQLKDKLKNTSMQVQAIVSNFQRVHTDLQDLKNEYIQQQIQEMNDIDNQTDVDPTSTVQIKQQIDMKKVHSESLQNIQSSIEKKKSELRGMMDSFSKIKNELSDISKQKESIQENHELLQLEQLRDTLDETIIESEKLGQDDLIQLDQTIGVQPSNSELVNVSQTIDQTSEPQDLENIQLEENTVEEQDDSTQVNKDESLIELEGEIIRAQQSNQVIQRRITEMLA